VGIEPIKNERDYEVALRRVELLWNSPKASPEADELDMLAALIQAYEREHYPLDIAEAGLREMLDEEN
jgi:HTH-type transcriptional regulator / antitoxin HigA